MTIGTRKDLPVRLGNSLQPRLIKLSARRGVLNLDAGDLVTGIYLREGDMTPLTSPNFTIVNVASTTASERWWRIELGPSAVLQLANAATAVRGAAAPSLRGTPSRTVYWTASFQESGGARYPLYYGSIPITLGAAGA